MLETLVQKGRLLIISASHMACQTCPAKAGCVIISSTAKSYLLAPLPFGQEPNPK
jgi:hypothetical protein